MVLLLPFAWANIRWPVAGRIYATDSTLTIGGAAVTHVLEALAEERYVFVGHHGERVQLDQREL